MTSDRIKCHITEDGILIPGCMGVGAHNYEDYGTNQEIIDRFCTCNVVERPSYELLALENEALKARLSVLQTLEGFVRDRVADRETMLQRKSGYHARRICLEAEALLKRIDHANEHS